MIILKPLLPSTPFRVYVKNFDGKTTSVFVNQTDTVFAFKTELSKILGLPSEIMRLIYCVKQLDDSKTIACYNIQKDCTISLFLTLRGGMHHESSTGVHY